MESTASELASPPVSATGGSARSQADELDPRRWRPRRFLSMLVRLVSFLVPLAVAVVVVHFVGKVVARPSGSLAVAAWVAGLAVLATLTVAVVDHFARRLLPLGALLKLSLVFPDHAPSRFAIALRTGSGKALERAVANANSVEGFPAPQESAEQVVALIAAVSRHDRLTRGHSERVRAYSDLIGQELGLDEESTVKLHWAALVHDVGKLDVPAEILTKKGRPTSEEWIVLQGHPAASAHYLRGLDDWLGEWGRAATEHHERFDGDGYPLGLRGEEISLAGRIVAVADAFDVMTSARSYKKPHPAARARAELAENAGTQFAPVVVRAFLSVSLRELRLVMGPLAFLSQLPALAHVPLEAVTAAFAPSVAALAAGAIALAAPAHSSTPATRPADSVSTARAGTPGAANPGTANGDPESRSPASTVAKPGGEDGEPGEPGVVPPGATTTTPTGERPSSTPTTRPGAPPGTAPVTTPPTVAPANRPPVAVKDTPKGKYTTRTVTVDVLANDQDPDGNLAPSTLTIVRYPTPDKYESISIVGGKVRFTAPESYPGGAASFRYQVCDTSGSCAQAEVTLNFDL